MGDTHCSVSDCAKPARLKGWCVAHYTRNRRNGDPETRISGRGLPEAERFWRRVNAEGPCWIWTGARTGSGYGNFRVGDTVVVAHRYAWENLVGPIPEGMVLDHLCRVRCCVNPEHLEVVTVAENTLRGMSPATVTYRTDICRRGHDMKQTARIRSGRRSCYACEKETADA